MGPRAGLDRCRKFRPPPGFALRIVQPVTSHYSHYAIPAHNIKNRGYYKINTPNRLADSNVLKSLHCALQTENFNSGKEFRLNVLYCGSYCGSYACCVSFSA